MKADSQSNAAIASRMNLSVDTVRDHFLTHETETKLAKGMASKKTSGPIGKRPLFKKDETLPLIDQVRSRLAWLNATLEWHDANGASLSAMANIDRQIGKATQELAKLSGLFAISENQVVKSPFCVALIDRIVDACGEDVALLERMMKAIRGDGG